jgi:hypothetical protein
MYRDHVWISTLRRLLAAQVLVPLSASAAWGQQAFSDHIQGYALACKYVPYNISGSANNHYYPHTTVRSPRCGGLGPTTAGSSATVGPPTLSGSATATKSTAAVGPSVTTSFDKAILTPPSGWNGSVPVTLKSSYTFKVQGASAPSTAGFSILWYIDSVLKKSEKVTTDGHGTLNFSFEFEVQPTGTGYDFVVRMDGGSGASAMRKSGSSSASFSTSFIDFVLPKGWTSKWLSNGATCLPPLGLPERLTSKALEISR